MLGVISSRSIHLIFNYRSGLVGLELTQNICEGREFPMVSWRYFNKQKIEISFKMKKMSQTPKNSTIKVIELEQNTGSKYKKYTTLLYKQLLKNYPF